MWLVYRIYVVIICFQRKHRDEYAAGPQPGRTVPPEQTSLNRFLAVAKKYDPSDPRQRRASDSLVQFVACGQIRQIPLSVLENEDFCDFVKQLNPSFQLPSRKHLSKVLFHDKVHAAMMQDQLKEQLKKSRDCLCNS